MKLSLCLCECVIYSWSALTASVWCFVITGFLIVLWSLFHLHRKRGNIILQWNHCLLNGAEVCLPSFHLDFYHHQKYHWWVAVSLEILRHVAAVRSAVFVMTVLNRAYKYLCHIFILSLMFLFNICRCLKQLICRTLATPGHTGSNAEKLIFCLSPRLHSDTASPCKSTAKSP